MYAQAVYPYGDGPMAQFTNAAVAVALHALAPPEWGLDASRLDQPLQEKVRSLRAIAHLIPQQLKEALLDAYRDYDHASNRAGDSTALLRMCGTLCAVAITIVASIEPLLEMERDRVAHEAHESQAQADRAREQLDDLGPGRFRH